MERATHSGHKLTTRDSPHAPSSASAHINCAVAVSNCISFHQVLPYQLVAGAGMEGKLGIRIIASNNGNAEKLSRRFRINMVEIESEGLS